MKGMIRLLVTMMLLITLMALAMLLLLLAAAEPDNCVSPAGTLAVL